MSTRREEDGDGQLPFLIADALAAAGVLAGAGLDDVGRLADVVGRETRVAYDLVSPLLRWSTPPETLLEPDSFPALAEAWRSSVDLARIRRGTPTVRLWVHHWQPAATVRALAAATPPQDGALVLSAAKANRESSRALPRWTWPLLVGIDTTTVGIGALLTRQPVWLTDLVRFVDLDDPTERCSLALVPGGWTGSWLDDYGRPRAAAALVMGPDPGGPAADEMLDDAGLGALGAVAFTQDTAPQQLVEVVRQLSHDLSFDEAVTLAVRGADVERPAIYGEAPFLDRTRVRRQVRDHELEIPHRLPWRPEELLVGLEPVARTSAWIDSLYSFDHEIDGATDAARYLGVQDTPENRRHEPRFLHGEAQLRRGSPTARDRGFDLSVWIGVSLSPGFDDQIFIDELDFEWELDTVDLDIVLIPMTGRRAVRTRRTTLPRVGESTRATFAVRASRATPFRGRLVVLRDFRFVQTALVTVSAEGEVVLEPEAVVRSLTTDLQDLVPATAAIVHNHTGTGQALITPITGQGSWSVIPDKVYDHKVWFRQTLERIANDPAAFVDASSAAFAETVIALALEGAELNRLLFAGEKGAITTADAATELAAADHLSVLSVIADDVLPLELVYDRELSLPPRGTARLCPQAQTAAASKTCCGIAANQDRRTVCPFGFWGVRKVIERHVNREDNAALAAQGAGVTIGVSPTLTDSVAVLRNVLGAASSRADLNPEEDWKRARDQLTTLYGTNVRFADDWTAWMNALHDDAADVLLLLPHVGIEANGDPYLEIGNDPSVTWTTDVGYVLFADPWAPHPQHRAPIVLLLGCATAGGPQLQKFPGKFLDRGARLVIGTLAVVRGRFVAPLGAELTEQLLDQSNGHGVRVGELLRDLRRRAFERGDPTAMTLVAFGDSSWVLKRR